MERNIVEQKELTFIGFHTTIAAGEGYQKCPQFWEREFNQKYSHLWQTMKPENKLEQAVLDHGIGAFAICEDHERDFDYWIAGLYQGGEVPEGLSLFSYKAGKWAVFQTRGPLPSSIQQLNDYVIGEWYAKEGKARGANLGLMIEKYAMTENDPSEPVSEIWVPIER